MIINTNCGQTTLEIDPAYHREGQTYEWIFPGYENHATYLDNNKKVAFDTEDLKQFAEDEGQVEPVLVDPNDNTVYQYLKRLYRRTDPARAG